MDILLHDLEERIIPDGNCSFRSLSYFLYNTPEKHRQVILKIISNVIKNWSYFQPFIIGDESHGISIIDQKMYKSHMSQDGVYGEEVEVQSFVQIYNCLEMSLSVRPFSDLRFSSYSLRPYSLAGELAWLYVRNGRSALIRGHDPS